mmetsp:Transcript_34107/g.77031  ORF Transcript_34107/g.77031 Transcript_34107/m.77031 type:complete len:265 (+) Transcript_34107:2325-3119(+)
MSTSTSSVMMGTLRPGWKGCSTHLPCRCLYRGSSGWTATAVSPSMVSRRVVATTISSPLPSTLYANSVNIPNWYLACLVWLGTASHVPPSMSSCSTSMSLMADLSLQDQLMRRLSRKRMPFSWKRQKASTTALEHLASIVNASRDQSTEEPSSLIWVQILEPYASFHSHTFSRNLSRPRSCLVSPCSFMSIFSTTDWVAIPAWSVPGRYRAGSPFMRCHRVKVSSMAAVRAWPRWSDPVTLGGGITMTNRPASPAALPLAASAV